jgi:hypothetical protein
MSPEPPSPPSPGPDKSVVCRLCGKPIQPGEPRYREPEGDVHLECRKRQGRPE